MQYSLSLQYGGGRRFRSDAENQKELEVLNQSKFYQHSILIDLTTFFTRFWQIKSPHKTAPLIIHWVTNIMDVSTVNVCFWKPLIL